MDLNDRKRRILHAIINAYIDTGEPVGSKTVLSREDFGLSAATVRNEMSDLEKDGYLVQPHTSAGRIPSPAGFRFYVESLIPEVSLPERERSVIRSMLSAEINRLDRLFVHIAHVVSEVMECAALSIIPATGESKIIMFETALVNNRLTAIVMVCESGAVKTTVFRSRQNVFAEDASKLSKILNAKLSGIPVSEIGELRFFLVEGEIAGNCPAYKNLAVILRDMISELLEYDIAVEGEGKVFSFADFHDIEHAKRLYALLQSKEELLKLHRLLEVSGLPVIIGGGKDTKALNGVSILSAPYTLGGKRAMLAAIAPIRTDYGRLISALDYVTSLVMGYMDGDKTNTAKINSE